MKVFNNKIALLILTLIVSLASCSNDDTFYFTMNVAEKTVQVGDEYKFSVKLQDNDNTSNPEGITWLLLDQQDKDGNQTTVATIDNEGKVSALAEGTAKVKAVLDDAHYAIAYLTVSKRTSPKSGEIEFQKEVSYVSVTAVRPDTVELLVSENVAKNFDIVLTSDNEDIVKPSLLKVTDTSYNVILNLGGTEGKATITATAGNTSTTTTVYVGAKLYLSFSPISTALGEPTLNTISSATINVGETQEIPVYFLCTPDDQKHLESLNFYISTNGPALFKSVSQRVDLQNGIVYVSLSVGQDKGTAQVIIEAMGNTVTADVTVMDKNDVEVKSCLFTQHEFTTSLKMLSLYEYIKIKPISAAALWPPVWSSSDESIATVDEEGKVYIKKHGTVEITATSKDKSDKCTINAQLVVDNAAFTKYTTKMVAGESQQWEARINTNYENQEGLKKEWKSSNTGVATVSQNGLVTAVAAGNTTISLELTDDKGDKTTIAVDITVSDASNIKIYNLDFNTKTYLYGANGSLYDVYDPNDDSDKYYSFRLVDMSGAKITLNANNTYTVGTNMSTDSYVIFNEFNGEKAYLTSGTITVDASKKATFNLVAKEGSKTITIKGTVAKE